MPLLKQPNGVILPSLLSSTSGVRKNLRKLLTLAAEVSVCIAMSTMAANPYKGIWYTLELFPTEGNWQTYEKALGGTSLERKNDNAGFDLFTTAYASVPPGELAKLLDLGVKARMTKHWWSCEYGSPVERSEACLAGAPLQYDENGCASGKLSGCD